MAYLSASGGLAKDLYAAASNWLSHMLGQAGHRHGVGVQCFRRHVGRKRGSRGRDVEDRDAGNAPVRLSVELAAGAMGIGARLELLIPPSIAMVVYGVATQTSIGKLLIAGVIPGILVGAGRGHEIYIWVLVRPPARAQQRSPRHAGAMGEPRARVAEACSSSSSSSVLLYIGVATPSKVASIGAIIAAVVGVCHSAAHLAGA